MGLQQGAVMLENTDDLGAVFPKPLIEIDDDFLSIRDLEKRIISSMMTCLRIARGMPWM